MKILHTSDWHLGRLFHQQSLLDQQLELLHQLVNVIDEYAVDAVIIAGDIYDRSVPPSAAVKAFSDFVEQVAVKRQRTIVAISGNHDGAERLGFAHSLLKQAKLHLITDLPQSVEPVVLSDADTDVHLWCVPFHDPLQVNHWLESDCKNFNTAHQMIVDRINAQRSNLSRNIIVSHCYLDGASESESERPLSIGGADRVDWQMFADFDYAALGHLHQPQYKGREHIRYSGSLMKYSFSEVNQSKSVTLIDINNKGVQDIEQITLKPSQDMRVIKGELADLIKQAQHDPHYNDFIQAILTDKQAILHPMAKLRAYYPNLMQLRKEQFEHDQRSPAAHAQEQLKKADSELIQDFFSEVHGEPLTEDQKSAISQVIQQIEQEESGS
ncbi:MULTISPECIES: exonuclease SbcCD subunit D [unclassified Idiomarina]|uniref:exonuclease SbcCD subunit D n=1 Tax=unclassified Idiomarina TaxID=2614829 RepID=UPI000C97C0E2|nr:MULTISPECIES: exonuclease SbcCD subunit D [unclassified Idiomarina]MAD53315.1 exonuclease sbcCD subunit D [Idiomarinaceae bacterium]NQZ04764.1 exonuclease SbcCD subunit D [Idiomarina sp.]